MIPAKQRFHASHRLLTTIIFRLIGKEDGSIRKPGHHVTHQRKRSSRIPIRLRIKDLQLPALGACLLKRNNRFVHWTGHIVEADLADASAQRDVDFFSCNQYGIGSCMKQIGDLFGHRTPIRSRNQYTYHVGANKPDGMNEVWLFKASTKFRQKLIRC